VPLLKTRNHAVNSEKSSPEMRKFGPRLLSGELLKEQTFLATWVTAKQLKLHVRRVAPTGINICISSLGFTFPDLQFAALLNIRSSP